MNITENQDIFKADYLSQLNEQQRAAVEYLDGPQLVIAGAGSGKTRVLAYKIVHLLAKGYEPWRIMALTFTNKAAREMRERIASLVGDKIASRIVMGTFHSVFARMIRTNADRLGIKSGYTIYDASDSKNLIKTIIKEMQLDEKVYKPSSVASEISSAKNALMSPEAYAADRDIVMCNKRANRQLLPAIYRAYVERCRRADALDFDDLLYFMNVLLRDNADIRRHYEEYFRYVLVDEYQDTNFAQHMIINQLCKETRGLCVVGDDAQSIYSFRGANITNILNLERTFRGLQIFKLERNYRSTQNIINAAGSLIAANTRQIPKNVFSENGVGMPVELVRCYSDYEESFVVANKLSQIKMSSDYNYNDFAILYRTNAQSRVLEESLRKRNIPYRIYGGLSFYQRKEVKDIIAYLRLALNPDDEEAIKRVINFPPRGIGDTTVRKLTTAVAESSSATLWQVILDPDKYDVKINNGTKAKLKSFSDIVNNLSALDRKGASAYDIALAVYALTKIPDLYRFETTPENISKLDNINELISGVKDFVEEAREQGADSNNAIPADSLAAYMSQVALASDVDTTDRDESNNPDADKERVTLMTIHAAKGLEFSNIFVVGVEDDLLPSAMSKDSIDQFEEERRLLYVAITRAKKYCMLSYATSRYRNGQTVLTKISPFIKDIDRKYIRSNSADAIESTSFRESPRTRYSSSFGMPKFQPTAYSSTRERATSSNPTPIGSQNSVTAGADKFHSADELKVGMSIKHSRFGLGKIIDIDRSNPTGDRIKVDFKQIDVKTLLLKFAKFTIIG